MRNIVLFAILIFAVFFGSAFIGISIVMAQDELPVAEDVDGVEPEVILEEEVKEEGAIGQVIVSFLNSPLGITIVISLISFILGKVFTAKPKWKALVLKFGPSIMQAVKYAEKEIPDDVENKGLSKINNALAYLIELEPKLKLTPPDDLKRALTAVHASAEANGNLKKD